VKIFFRKIIFLFYILPLATWSANTDPWFTGPLFENHPVTMPVGQGFVGFSSNDVANRGFFDTNGNVVSTPRTSVDNYAIDFAYGLSENTDYRINVMYLRNLVSGSSYSNLGDTTMHFGYQVFRQKNSRWLPDLRLTIEEIFPTGRWDHLNPADHGADSTGVGSFQTAVGIRVRKMIPLPYEHFLVLHGRFAFNHPSPVPIDGFSIYGGALSTKGTLTLGNSALLDFALEYNFTKNWGGVFEGAIITQAGSDFSGELSDIGSAGVLPRFIFAPGSGKIIAGHVIRSNRTSRIVFNNLMPSKLNLGRAFIGNGNNLSFNLAPAIEYNFSDSVGVIGGPYFNLMGRNMPIFMCAAVSIYKNWKI
jgi:hypothetical protein